MTKLVFFGPQGSGKTTTAREIVRRNNRNFQALHLPLADALRAEVVSAIIATTRQGERPVFADASYDDDPFTWIIERTKDPKTKEQWRPLLQVWGTELRRQIYGTDYWLRRHDTLVAEYVAMYGDTEELLIAVDDVRFFNEYAHFREQGYKFIRCEPAAQPRRWRFWQRSPKQHASEREWQLFKADLILPWKPLEDRLAHVQTWMHNGYA